MLYTYTEEGEPEACLLAVLEMVETQPQFGVTLPKFLVPLTDG